VLDAFKTKTFFHFPPHFLSIGWQSQSLRAVKPQFGLSLRGNHLDAAVISRLKKAKLHKAGLWSFVQAINTKVSDFYLANLSLHLKLSLVGFQVIS